ncbi:unnamed protein product [Lampetra planeri]
MTTTSFQQGQRALWRTARCCRLAKSRLSNWEDHQHRGVCSELRTPASLSCFMPPILEEKNRGGLTARVEDGTGPLLMVVADRKCSHAEGGGLVQHWSSPDQSGSPASSAADSRSPEQPESAASSAMRPTPEAAIFPPVHGADFKEERPLMGWVPSFQQRLPVLKVFSVAGGDWAAFQR